jgi:hypothetical protein
MGTAAPIAPVLPFVPARPHFGIRPQPEGRASGLRSGLCLLSVDPSIADRSAAGLVSLELIAAAQSMFRPRVRLPGRPGKCCE